MKVEIIRVLNLDGTWQDYCLHPNTGYGKYEWKEPGKTFNSLDEIIKFYNLRDIKELGTKFNYDNKGQKYGIESYSAIIN